MAILGSQYSGEMRDGLFGLMNYQMPRRNVLPMNAASFASKKGDVTVMFGSKSSGRTALAISQPTFIGDAGHCWSENGIFNVDSAVYTGVNYINKEKNP